MSSRLSIRARVTLGSVLVAAILLTAALFVVREQVSATLQSADVTLAQSDLTAFVVDIKKNPGEPVDDPGTGILVYVRGPNDTVQVDTLPHDVRAQVQDHAAENSQTSLADDEGRTFVVIGRSVTTPLGTWALWSARSTSASQLALQGLDQVLIVGGIALLAGFGIASWLLATVALRPVSAMRRRAEELGTAHSDATLPVGRANDELAALATTLNALLARTRASTDRERQMVSDAAHELRTPLAALKTQLELARSDYGDAAALAAHLVSAAGSVDRLGALAANLLELSRLEAQETTPTATGTSLVDEFNGSIDRARLLGLAKSADITFDTTGDESHTYAIDAQAFGRLIDNLLSNAVNAIHPSGSIQAALNQNDVGLRLEIRDDGPGMPPSFIPVAFDRFSRPDASRAAATGGSGLGLALVSALASAAGGRAELRNEQPGLLVTVTIPKM
ncbi:MAG: HAMP domain-containing sensor histidine kinase [Rhodoglobus sp.]